MAFRFRKFKVYQDAKLLHRDVVRITNGFQKEHFYLVDQIRRSSLSIILNIAEGSSKQSDKDFNRFISMSLGSVDETMAILEVSHDSGIINSSQLSKFESQLEDISNQLGAFSKTLRNKS